MKVANLSRKETAKKKRRKSIMIFFLILSSLVCGIMLITHFTNKKPLTDSTLLKNANLLSLQAEAETVEELQSPLTILDKIEGKEVIKTEVESQIIEEQIAEEQTVIAGDVEKNVSSPIKEKENKAIEIPTTEEESTISIMNSVSGNQSMIILEHIVKKQETIYSISKLYYDKNEVEYLLRYNQMKNPQLQLKAGMVLLIPNPTYLSRHKVHKGETLYQIVRTYYSKPNLLTYLAQVNNIRNPSTDIKVGINLNVFHEHRLIQHKVMTKETLYSVMSTYYQFSDFLSLIKDANKLTENVKEGAVIKITNPYQNKKQSISETTKVKWTVKVMLAQNKIDIYQNGKLIKTSIVATGKNSFTPKGTYQIITKISNPGYTPGKISGGDPRNPLGTRWLGLNVPGTTGRTYGIHGTIDPTSLGKYVTNGCIRLDNDVIEEIFDLLPVGTTVVIN
ncbi:L,D-transpeptidase family protein [Bacillus sp. DJP31]|uniref:L,D-transpeptidase family protein n=1 Tax=Bacillus sp. DJP31 TaxID=3409789 RepID=UPI003BB5E443